MSLHAQAVSRQQQPTEDRVSSFVARWPEWTALALYALLVGFAIPYHEPWTDEAQAWQLARTLSLHDLFHTYLRYEGSPGLWHFLLWILNRLHVSYAGMHWVSGGIALLGISVLVFCAPFPRYIKLTLPFTYFLAFQYSVVARNYVLAPLLLFAIAALWKKGPVVVAILLGLLGNVALHLLAISGGLAIVYAIDQGREQFRTSGSRSRLIMAAVLLALFYAFAIWTVLPPGEFLFGNAPPPISGHGVHLLGGLKSGALRMLSSLLWSVTQPILLGVLVWLAVIFTWHRRRRMFYLIPAASFAIFSSVYLRFWHAGLIVLLMISLFWIGDVKGPALKWPDSAKSAVLLATIAYLLAVQLGWTIHAVVYDHSHDYSPALATTRFLWPYVAAGDKVAVTYLGDYGAKDAFDVEMLPYFSSNIYMNQDRPFWWWSARNKTEANFEDALQKRPAVILVEFVEGHLFNLAHDMSDPKIEILRRADYTLTHTFCGQQPERFGYAIPVCTLIFQPKMTTAAPSGK